MALTHLDPTAALLVIDLQKGVVGLPTVSPADDIVAAARRLADAFRLASLPVVFVTVAGSPPGRTDSGLERNPLPDDWAHLVPALGVQPGDHCVVKQGWGAFPGTDLSRYLRERGVTQLFILGIATSLGVESTAREAHSLGFHVVLVTDAMTDLNAAAHQNSIDWVFPMLGETASTADILGALREPG